MSNLYAILQDAQGGQALDNLAKQFNISKEEADAAVRALLPALSTGFLSKATEPGALGSIIGALGDGQHLAAFADPAAAQSQATAQKGDEVLVHLFGSSQVDEQIVQRASAATGLKPELLAQMLPVIASVIVGGVTKSLQSQGFGGIFTQLVNAARHGGLSSILGSLTEEAQALPSPQSRPSAAPSASSPGGFGGILATFIGSLLGRLGAPPSVSAPAPAPQAPGLDSRAIQAAIEALAKVFQPGTPSQSSRVLSAVEIEPKQTESPRAESEETGLSETKSQPHEPAPLAEIRNEIGEILDSKRH
ncbi:DUF937 domain-containing protein [Methylocapsa polymorpha]|uniref:DUF937 domain-containing protein n=1 Tax=Methylocapsa polymorpha TaxID=3080828 RepID=A0ABZ0HQ85_9HYPH|nr:DUF937 domain-containing protein [Methylocapsa sp. RX1]